MKSPLCKILSLVIGLIVFGTGVASAQTDVYRLNYFNGLEVGEGIFFETVRIDNPGLTYGNLCAMIYVFDRDQQLTECCGCVQSHNNLSTIPLFSLISNPLTGNFPLNGVIKIVSAAVNNSPCDPSTNVRPTPNLREWGTHFQLTTTAPGFNETETEFSPSTLGATELANLQAQCSFINILGSGNGICRCGPLE